MPPDGDERTRLLGLADRTDVHDDLVAPVADAVLRVGGRVQLVVDHGQAAVVVEEDLAEAERVAGAFGAGVCGGDADDLRAVRDLDEDAVLHEGAGAVLEGGVAGKGDGRDVRVPRDRHGLARSGLGDVAAVADGAFRDGKDLVEVGGADVDRSTAVAVADQSLEVVVLAVGRPAVADDDVAVLVQADALTLVQGNGRHVEPFLVSMVRGRGAGLLFVLPVTYSELV